MFSVMPQAAAVSVGADQLVGAAPAKVCLSLDGKATNVIAYEIGGERYYKLRDLAKALDTTDKQFNVQWDDASNSISITTGKGYSAVGGELSSPEILSTMSAVLSNSSVYLDGNKIDFTVYSVEGYNYFKLCDFASVLNFGVTLSNENNTVKFDTKATYKTIENTIRIGALLSLSGSWTSQASGVKSALEIALPEVNNYLKSYGLKIELDIRDTGTSSDKALTELKSLHDSGVTTVIGPMGSQESLSILDYANQNGMLLLSPSATSSELSLKDNFFRNIATDESQIDGLADLIVNKYSLSKIIAVYVDDSYGRGFYNELKKVSGPLGIEISDSIAIPADSTDYEAIAAKMEAAASGKDSNKTTVVLMTTGEAAVEIIHQIPNASSLSSMKWFVDGDIIGSEEFLYDKAAAAFGAKTKMEGMMIGYKYLTLDALPYVGMILEGAADATPYALTAWDSLWLIAETYKETPKTDIETLKNSLVGTAGNFRNVFGAVNTMDKNGDTVSFRYMRYILSEVNCSYSWQCKGHFVNVGLGKPIIKSFNWNVSADKGEVEIGALLPLTGYLYERGAEIKKTLDLAVVNFNQYAAECGSALTIKLVVEDTKSDPATALTLTQKLVDRGIKCMIGGVSSAELERIKPLVDSSGVIMISPLSTSPSLAAADNIYRMILNDTIQSKAISDLIKKDGINRVVIMNSDDTYGNELTEAFKKAFAGDVVSISYKSDETDFSKLLNEVNDAVKQGDLSKTAVLAISNDEIAKMLEEVNDDSALSQVKWYGSDSSVLTEVVLNSQKAASMAIKVNFTATEYSPYGKYFDPLYEDLHYRVNASGILRESSASSFDGLWLMACAYLEKGALVDTNTINQYVASGGFKGVGGVLSFDQNGDRKFGYYKIYHVEQKDGEYVWENVGLYSQDYAHQGTLEMYS